MSDSASVQGPAQQLLPQHFVCIFASHEAYGADTMSEVYHVACRYENTDSLTVDCPPSVLAPGQSQEVSISFCPCEAQHYREVVPIRINGLYTVKLVLLGEGTPLRLELANPAHRLLNLGAVSLGSQATKTVQVRMLFYRS